MTEIGNGLRIESAASVLARDMIQKHIQSFSHVIMHDRAANASVVAAYIDGLSAAIALTIMGSVGFGKESVTEGAIAKLRENIERDLKHLIRK